MAHNQEQSYDCSQIEVDMELVESVSELGAFIRLDNADQVTVIASSDVMPKVEAALTPGNDDDDVVDDDDE